MNIFMGGEFSSQEELRRTFPAYATDDAWRAIQNGAKTPHEVEVFCFKRRQKGAVASRKAARENKSMQAPAAAKAQARRARGGKATAKRRKAA